MSHRLANGLDFIHAFINSGVDNVAANAELARPLGDGLRHAIYGNAPVCSSVVGLFCARGPSAIVFAVVAVIVFALKRAALRSWANIDGELCKRFEPLFADGDAAPAVVRKPLVGGVCASGEHCLPGPPKARHATTGKRMVPALPHKIAIDLARLSPKTAAATRFKAHQGRGFDNLGVSAITKTKPLGAVLPIIFRPLLNDESANSLPCQVFCRHA